MPSDGWVECPDDVYLVAYQWPLQVAVEETSCSILPVGLENPEAHRTQDAAFTFANVHFWLFKRYGHGDGARNS